MPRTLPTARKELANAIRRDIPGLECQRLIGVLDALIAWSVARPNLLAFRTDHSPAAEVSFKRAGAQGVVWSARVRRGEGPDLEICPPTGNSLGDETRTRVMETLNAHSSRVLAGDDRLRISFGALKNPTAQAAVLGLLNELLTTTDQPASV